MLVASRTARPSIRVRTMSDRHRLVKQMMKLIIYLLCMQLRRLRSPGGWPKRAMCTRLECSLRSCTGTIHAGCVLLGPCVCLWYKTYQCGQIFTDTCTIHTFISSRVGVSLPGFVRQRAAWQPTPASWPSLRVARAPMSTSQCGAWVETRRHGQPSRRFWMLCK